MIVYRVKEIGEENYLGEHGNLSGAGYFCQDMDDMSKKHGQNKKHEIVKRTDRAISQEKFKVVSLTEKELATIINWGKTIDSDCNYEFNYRERGLLRGLIEESK